MRSPGDGESVFELRVDDSVSTDDERAGFVYFILTAGENAGKDLEGKVLGWERYDIECGERLAAHRVDVGQRVRSSNLTKVVRVVDDRREEIHRLDEREIVAQHEDPRVVEGLTTHENAAVGVHRHAAQRLGQVTRTQLGGSTSAAREAREAEELSARLVRRHGSGEW